MTKNFFFHCEKNPCQQLTWQLISSRSLFFLASTIISFTIPILSSRTACKKRSSVPRDSGGKLRTPSCRGSSVTIPSAILIHEPVATSQALKRHFSLWYRIRLDSIATFQIRLELFLDWLSITNLWEFTCSFIHVGEITTEIRLNVRNNKNQF